MGSLIATNTFAKGENATQCGRLGIEISPVENTGTPTKQTQNGVLVTQITPNSIAEKMHLATGDIIQSVNGQDILNATQLQQILYNIKAGSTVELTVARNGKQKTLYTRMKS